VNSYKFNEQLHTNKHLTFSMLLHLQHSTASFLAVQQYNQLMQGYVSHEAHSSQSNPASQISFLFNSYCSVSSQ